MRNIDKPLVSIALCTYNGEVFLAKQLNSLLCQDYNNLEIIVVDDRSTDNTWKILQRFAAKDKRLRLFQNDQNIGYARNFEKAIKLCKGDFIALADQDDIWELNKIKILTRAIKDCVMVYHNSDFIDEYDEQIGQITMASRFRMYEGQSCLPFILANCISGHATLFKKELVKYITSIDNNVYHDWWLSYAAFNVGKVKYVDEILVHYRQHKGSITDTLDLRKKMADPQIQPAKPERFSVDLNWINYCSKYKYNRESDLVSRACNLFSDLKAGKSKFSAFIFMVKYFDLLFYIIGVRGKNIFSKANFVRKICFA